MADTPARAASPEKAMAVFAASTFVFHQLPALAGPTAGDVIDLFTPFIVIGAAALALAAVGARGRVLVAAGAAAILYVHGQGIHLAANSINNEGPGPEVSGLVHFWDEVFSHYWAVVGWYGLIACICAAERRRVPAGAGDFDRTATLTAILFAWAFFTGAVEGGTWPLELATAAAFGYWLIRARRPLLRTAAAGYLLAALLIGAYAIWQGGVPQFTEAGLL